ncbi:hypothetical protein [Kribbella sp. NPDC048928]|uniref:hypothetical protein n=1 Tax=Kribbella sp. NPDC048928 TaxID=3364111 RepID=UPI0037130121
MSEQANSWACEVYGPDLPAELGHLCFYAQIERCTSEAQCHQRMIASRQQLFQRINELAAAGDPTGEYLAGEFTNPSQLLGVDEETEQ